MNKHFSYHCLLRTIQRVKLENCQEAKKFLLEALEQGKELEYYQEKNQSLYEYLGRRLQKGYTFIVYQAYIILCAIINGIKKIVTVYPIPKSKISY